MTTQNYNLAQFANIIPAATGTGNIVLANSPVLTTPNIGTPSFGNLTSMTGLPLTTGVTGILPIANGGTGATTSTGTGNVVLSVSPQLTTPQLGTPASGNLVNTVGLPLTTGVTGILPIANGGTGSSSATGAASNLQYLASGTGAVARSFASRLGDFISIKDFGAKGDGSTDDTAAIQAAVTAAAGRRVYVPVGQYVLSSTITSSVPVYIQGEGTGAGPGPAAQSNANVTQFLCNFSNADVFAVTSIYPSIFRDFQINVTPGYRPATAGAGIALYPTAGGTVANCRIENVAMQNVYDGIFQKSPSYPQIRGCYFDAWVNFAIRSVTVGGVEGSGGIIIANYFFGDISSSTTQQACIYSEVGYTIVTMNEILGSQYGVYFSVKNYPAGYFRVFQNTIEEQTKNGIVARSQDGNTAALIEIANNEFSVITNASVFGQHIIVQDYSSGTGWLNNLDIVNNTFQSSFAASQKYIWTQSGKNVRIAGNQMINLGAGPSYGIQIGGASSSAAVLAPFVVQDNEFSRVITKYNLSPSGVVRVIHTEPNTYATVVGWGVPGAGSKYFITDSNSTTFAAVPAGGGANGVPAYFDGTNLRVG